MPQMRKPRLLQMSKNASSLTIKYRSIYWVLQVIDWFIIWLPLVIYFFVGLTDGGVTTTSKFGLVTMFSIAMVLTIFNVITRHHLRSPLWLAIIGVYVALDNILPLIWMLAIGTLLDELLLQPALKKYGVKLEASKVYDEHQPTNTTGE